MSDSNCPMFSRRDFVARVMPVCALVCVTSGSALAMGRSEELTEIEAMHKFDEDSGRKLTHRQLMELRYGESIRLSKALAEEMGGEALLEFLKRDRDRRMRERGRNQAEEARSNSLAAFVKQFRDPEAYRNTLVREIIEDNEACFEMRVTECLWAEVFRAADAADIGYASLCHGDFAWARGFNPKITLTRNGTLMEGDPACDLRWVWRA